MDGRTSDIKVEGEEQGAQRSRPTRPVPSCKMVGIAPLLVASAALTAGPLPNQIKNLVTFGDSYTDIVSTGQHSTQLEIGNAS